MAHVYILFSEFLNRYYVGETSGDPVDRLRKHLTNHDGFTAKAKDWKIVHQEFFSDPQQAKKRELEIKSWKSRSRIQHLIGGSEHPA